MQFRGGYTRRRAFEGNSLFMNSETPEIRKVQVKLRGTTCCLQGRSTRATTWVPCPRFVKNCPETLVPGLETPAHRKLLGKYRNRPRGRNISKAFFSKHFCAFEGPSLIMSHVLNSANIENVNFERLLINYRGFEI